MSHMNQPPFRYTPGDRHRYEWDGGPYVTIVELFRGFDEEGIPMRSERTSVDVIPVPADTNRSAQALAALVDDYRELHPAVTP